MNHTTQKIRNDHFTHSSFVRNWRAKEALNGFGLDWKEGDSHILISPHQGHAIRISFSPYEEHPECIRVRSTNWRAEYEPNGIYDVKTAREFYKSLIDIGFVKI